MGAGALRRRVAASGSALAALGALVLLGALAAPAQAWRTPTQEELVALAGATGPPSDPACVSGRISTVDDRWGAVFARADGDCPDIERIWVLQRTAPGTPGSRWRELRQGLRFGVCAQDLPGIPDAAGADLGVCTAPSRRVYVPAGRGLAFKPSTLPYSRNASVTGVRWTSWGGATATGRGTFVYRDAYGGFRVGVTVTLAAIDLCGSRRTYLVKRVAALRPQDRDEVQSYSGRWPIQCPAEPGVPRAAAAGVPR